MHVLSKLILLSAVAASIITPNLQSQVTDGSRVAADANTIEQTTPNYRGSGRITNGNDAGLAYRGSGRMTA